MSAKSYASIVVSGPDAFEFLQNQLAGDLNACRRRSDSDDRSTDTSPILSAWCNPKGRVICLFRVVATDGGYALTLPSELADDVVRRLAMFRFRSKVEFKVEAAEFPEGWQPDQLRAGIVEIGKAQSEQFTPHMLNLDLLGAVSLDKGCYPGQEIVARTHYRGATKRRLQRFESAQPVAVGDKVSDGSRDVGEVVNAIGNESLAVVPTDLGDSVLTANGVSLKAVILPNL